jgi:hypothetical protein
MLKYSLIFGSILALEALITASTTNTSVTMVPVRQRVKREFDPFHPFLNGAALLDPKICQTRCLSAQAVEKAGIGFASLVWGTAEGVFDGAKSFVTGVWTLVTNPLGVAVNILHAGQHPEETALAIGEAIRMYCTNDGHPNAESIGKCIGMFFFISNLKVMPLFKSE